MYESILYAIGAVLATTGLVCIIYLIMIRAVRPADKDSFAAIAVFGPDDENAAASISYLSSKIYAAGDTRICRIIAVDNGMSDEQKQLLFDAFGKDLNVTLCGINELPEVLTAQKLS